MCNFGMCTSIFGVALCLIYIGDLAKIICAHWACWAHFSFKNGKYVKNEVKIKCGGMSTLNKSLSQFWRKGLEKVCAKIENSEWR
jgi:hypothetical protein